MMEQHKFWLPGVKIGLHRSTNHMGIPGITIINQVKILQKELAELYNTKLKKNVTCRLGFFFPQGGIQVTLIVLTLIQTEDDTKYVLCIIKS